MTVTNVIIRYFESYSQRSVIITDRITISPSASSELGENVTTCRIGIVSLSYVLIYEFIVFRIFLSYISLTQTIPGHNIKNAQESVDLESVTSVGI